MRAALRLVLVECGQCAVAPAWRSECRCPSCLSSNVSFLFFSLPSFSHLVSSPFTHSLTHSLSLFNPPPQTTPTTMKVAVLAVLPIIAAVAAPAPDAEIRNPGRVGLAGAHQERQREYSLGTYQATNTI